MNPGVSRPRAGVIAKSGRTGRDARTGCTGTPTTACWITGVRRSAGAGTCVTSWVTLRVGEPMRRGGAARERSRLDGVRLLGAVVDPPVRWPLPVMRVPSCERPGWLCVGIAGESGDRRLSPPVCSPPVASPPEEVRPSSRDRPSGTRRRGAGRPFGAVSCPMPGLSGWPVTGLVASKRWPRAGDAASASVRAARASLISCRPRRSAPAIRT